MSNERRKQFPFDEFEPRWQAAWEQANAFRTPNPGDADFDAFKPKFFVLDMFPYPSGNGLHVGHPEGYTATDIIGRYKRMNGFNVLHPMGWDAFGLPAEQYAIKTGQHPRATTERNVENFRGQLKRLGFAYDWDREVNTTDPGYFKWTQWIFLKLYGSYVNEEGKARPISELEAKGLSREEIDTRRLAYVSEAPVWWCEGLGTVLANEEVVEGKSEVGGHPVQRRPMKQWMLRITAMAERLINELDGLDWPEGIKLLQQNWIGRSEGASVQFEIAGKTIGQDFSRIMIEVYTTRPDTLFGATYLVLAPDHPFAERIATSEQGLEVRRYVQRVGTMSERERLESKDKTGVFTGAYAINPMNKRRIPIWIADYVLMGYGTGAIMAVPAHDERDWDFANKFGLPIVQTCVQAGDGFWITDFLANQFIRKRIAAENHSRKVVHKITTTQDITQMTAPGGSIDESLLVFHSECRAFTDDGVWLNEQVPASGMMTDEARMTMIGRVEQDGYGNGTLNYKLRDWLFSRQRYWGEPFPIVWEGGHHHAIPESELPLLPPDLADFKPTGTPEPPLSKATEWVKYSATATRELNTMPQWAGSCWYYLRYCDARNSERFVGEAAERYWMSGGKPGGVDLYVGGTEHAVLHLLYARFWHKVLFDLGYVSTPEPFQRLVNQGMVLGDDGQKMSKSRGNVVTTDEVTIEYGADSLRLYEMFMGPLEQVKPWSMKGVEGVYRFLARVWRLVMETNQEGDWIMSEALQDVPADKKLNKVLHETIKKCGEDIEKLSFNTAIAQMMVLTNAFTQSEVRPVGALVTFLKVLSPFAPHVAEEIHSIVHGRFPQHVSAGFVTDCEWPKFDLAALIEDEIEIVFQVNGKLRDRATVPVNASKEEIEKLALASPKVGEFIKGLTVRKIIVVPGKLVNVVAN